MKQDTVMRVALWLIEITSSGPDEEAFGGDLLELLAAGRSRRWCFAQALRRMTSAIEERLRSLLMPLWFCIGFVLLHPLWQRLCTPSVANLLTRYRETSQWPGSAVLEMIAGLLPAVFFVWAGIFIYSLLRHRSLQLHLVSAVLSLNVGGLPAHFGDDDQVACHAAGPAVALKRGLLLPAGTCPLQHPPIS